MMKKALFIAFAIGMIANANAQTSFSWSPNDTIIQDVDPDLYTEMLIEQVNLTGDSLVLGVEVVYNDAPDTWDGMICTYGVCLGSIQPTGFTSEMSPIIDTVNGYTKLTVYPAGGTESMKLRIRVFDTSNPTDGDTCTWIVNSVSTTGIEQMDELSLTVFPNPTTESFRITSEEGFDGLTLIDVQGKEVMNKSFYPTIEKSVNVSGLRTGIYFVSTYSGTEMLGSQKIVVR